MRQAKSWNDRLEFLTLATALRLDFWTLRSTMTLGHCTCIAIFFANVMSVDTRARTSDASRAVVKLELDSRGHSANGEKLLTGTGAY